MTVLLTCFIESVNMFMDSIASLESSPIQHDVHLANYEIFEKIDDRRVYTLG